MREDTDMPSVDTSPVDIVDTHGRTSDDFDTDCGDSDSTRSLHWRTDSAYVNLSLTLTQVLDRGRAALYCRICGWLRATENCGCVRAGYRAPLPGDHPANVVSLARRD